MTGGYRLGMAQSYEASIEHESTWARSVYVYGVLLGSGIAAVAGLVLSALAVVTLINPQSGMSGWERVLVGVPTVLDEGLDIAEEYFAEQRGGMPDYCTADMTEDDPDFMWCEDIREELASPIVPEEADQAIALVRDETLRQIRHGSIGRLVIGIVVFVAGALIFMRHKKLVALYGGPADEPPAAAPAAAVPPAATDVPPPPATT